MINEKEFLWKLKNISMTGVNGLRLDDLTLEINSGITALIGPSGSGKSSLLNIISEFEHPCKGSINKSDKVKSFFWVPPNHGLWPHMRVGEHLDAMTIEPIKDATDEMLARFEILEKKNAFPSQLSEGEKSRLAIARALIASPAVLVMDEPLINIDPAKQMLFWDKVVEMARECEISLIYATHSPKHVVGTADNVICMRDALVIYYGNVEELYHSPPNMELAEYLGDINWITEDDKIFLPEGAEPTFPLSLRPEQVVLKKNHKGKYKVIKSMFRGEITKTIIEDKDSDNSFELYHRPAFKPEAGGGVDLIFK